MVSVIATLHIWSGYDSIACSCFTAGVHVQLQGKLLDQDNFSVKPDDEFLELFADVVGSQWPSLAASLALSEEEIMEVRKGDVSQRECAFKMLHKWVSTSDATYGQLRHKLMTFSMFD